MVNMTPKFENVGDRNTSNFFKEVSSPKRNEGKENKPRHYGFQGCARRLEYTPQEEVLKPLNTSESWNNVTPTLSKITSCDVKTESSRRNSRLSVSKQSSNPLFDPELSAFYGEELVEEGERIKNLVSPNIRTYKAEGSKYLLELLEEKCPPGGDKAVIIYTTTLRGIRKTFEECNLIRSLIQSHHVYI
ncbi:hypothetical protein IFM89_031414 [Coptis chinensis]|uniref:Uncharacterized protein n=1 Tax=Coptis chinensis TaxID=261450 RepID=A0A835HGR2_9MAGN|nr:hypothetical protein IFM89_031414 [Coptis chinensis]